MKQQTIKLKVSELVEDFDLYPRAQVGAGHVAHIVEAIESGADLPQIIIDAKSKRIVDGFHRRRAYKRVHGDDYIIEVIAKSYRTEAELFLDAMRYNACHGRNMTSFDRTHAIQKAYAFEIDPSLIANALNMKVERVTEFKTERCAKLENSRRVIPLKLPVRHMRGRLLTKEQADVMPKLGGNQQLVDVE